MVNKNYTLPHVPTIKRLSKLNELPATFQHPNDDNTKTNKKKKQMSYFQLFRYSTKLDKFLIFIAVLAAAVGSLGVPFSIVIYGEFTTLLIDRTVGIGTSSPAFILSLFGGGRRLTNASKSENMEALKEDSIAYGIGSLVGAFIELIIIALSVDLFNRVALKQIETIRKRFLKSILVQDMSWFDTSTNNTNFASKMTEDLDKMKEGMGEKVAIFTFLLMTFITGIIVSLLYGWKLTMVVCACAPFIIISTAMVAKIQSSLTEKELQAYSSAGSVAEEVFSGIRTVFAFSGEKKETERFSNLLLPAEKTGYKKGLYSGIGNGIMWLLIYIAYAVAVWYGVRLILDNRGEENPCYTPGILVIVIFTTVMGSQNLGFSLPHLEAFGAAKGAAQNVFPIIDRKSEIDPLDERGTKPNTVIGDLTFENIFFRYPARPDVEILKGFSLHVKAGETVALVGASGCGKSTAIQLMQRFYDPLDGCVKLDKNDLRDLNVGWLRAQIGVVGQEPVLFATTIGENIRYGKPTATQEEIQNAAQMANCHDFITKLPKGYDTLVGERGAQMSGGQKQRIAIARALIRNPKILLLDEATSALDPTSERRVQDALEVASKGRTTLVVSHRLSTITNSDKIVFVKDGVVAEQGTHDELMAKGGLYCQLVNITKRKEETEEFGGGNTSTTNLEKLMGKKKQNDDEDESESEEESEDDEPDMLSVTSGERKTEKKKSGKKRKQKEKYKVSFGQLMRMNAPEWRYILFGCLASMMHGATFPAWSIVFGDFFGVMSSDDNDYVKSKANFLSYVFIIIGVISGIATLMQAYMFTVAGTKMTSRLRKTAFKTIITQDVAYFDDEKNSVGAMCSRLAGDCSNVQGATGARVGIIIQAISTFSVGIVVALIFSWNLTLVTLITIPFTVLSIMFESRFMESSAIAEKKAIENASQVAVEALANIRTVTSLGHEKYVIERYEEQIDLVDISCKRKLRFRGVVFGLGQAAPLIAYGVSLFYGGFLVANEKTPYENIIKVSEALIFGSWMLGQALAYAPNVSAAILSAGRLLKLFERRPAIHNPSDNPYNTVEKSTGDITFENVDFHYPARKEIQILENLNLHIKSGTTVALVGPSGSGKSTCVQLLLKYYIPDGGSVNLSGVSTTEFSYDTLRSQMGLVSQEPVLFDRTIAENIAYGDNFRENIPLPEIIEAAIKSNIHNFITALPQGYATSLGKNGAQLSGGQKQRIAIARALIRNPKILILDEATSALDMESEKVVQDALDAARHGRTCVTIAHRLTTIRDADKICVLRKGIVVEQGTHDELMAANGIYAELYMMQQVS